jgi:isopentenyl-diphosphate Delta-isomerase
VSTLQRRKARHLEACLSGEVEYTTRRTGFERLDLPYRALPETDLAGLDTAVTFLGKRLRAPLLIGAMTGGAEMAGLINRHLAEAAARLGLGMMLGSQRVMLERPETRASFDVRSVAPDILLVGNLGVAQLVRGYGASQAMAAVRAVGADAIAFHTNPLQEALQEGGDGDFRGVVQRLRTVVGELEVPVVLKEVGHGIGASTARSVADVPFAAIDVAGAGGTSWAKVEDIVRYGSVLHPDLVEWGIPTVTALREVGRELPGMPLIASGGVRSGLDVAKSIALGARVAAVARPLLAPALESADAVVAVLERLLFELRVAMHGCGAPDLATLSRTPLSER